MSTLAQRLQHGLIAKAPPIAHDWLRDTGHLKAATATIEADLKGLILETIGHAESCPLYRHPDEDDGCECACHIADIDAAIERYTRGE